MKPIQEFCKELDGLGYTSYTRQGNPLSYNVYYGVDEYDSVEFHRSNISYLYRFRYMNGNFYYWLEDAHAWIPTEEGLTIEALILLYKDMM